MRKERGMKRWKLWGALFALSLFLTLTAAAQGNTYYLPEIDITVTLPDAYEGYTREWVEENQEENDYFWQWMQEHNCYLDGLLAESYNEIYVTAEVWKDETVDYWSADPLKTLEETLHGSVGPGSYQIGDWNYYVTSQEEFRYFDYEIEEDGIHYYLLRYETFYNGLVISVTYSAFDIPITEEERILTMETVDSLAFGDTQGAWIEGPPASSPDTPILEEAARIYLPTSWHETDAPLDAPGLSRCFQLTDDPQHSLLYNVKEARIYYDQDWNPYARQEDIPPGTGFTEYDITSSTDVAAHFGVAEENVASLMYSDYYYFRISGLAYDLPQGLEATTFVHCANGLVQTFQFQYPAGSSADVYILEDVEFPMEPVYDSEVATDNGFAEGLRWVSGALVSMLPILVIGVFAFVKYANKAKKGGKEQVNLQDLSKNLGPLAQKLQDAVEKAATQAGRMADEAFNQNPAPPKSASPWAPPPNSTLPNQNDEIHSDDHWESYRQEEKPAPRRRAQQNTAWQDFTQSNQVAVTCRKCKTLNRPGTTYCRGCDEKLPR